ncbi:MAG: AAA family ATPase [Acidimicrobiales bacterium]|jgi:energy-coupling factor transporter ATP-binding protein EcfA2
MRVRRVRIENYRSIEDSGWIEVEPEITSLVGKNESGKTAFLQALFKLNPIEPAEYLEILDFPSRLTRKRKETDDPIRVCTAEFELTDDELDVIESDLGVDALTSRTFQVWRGYRSTGLTFENIKVDEAVTVRHLVSDLDLPSEAAAEARSATSLRQLIEVLSALPKPTPRSMELLDRIRAWPSQQVSLHLIDKHLRAMLPKFVYFDDYSTMPGKVSIPDLIQRRDQGDMDRGTRSLIALLSLIRGNPEDFDDESNHERLIRELENAANSISDEIFRYWSQNNDLSVDLKVTAPEPGAEPPLDKGPIFHVRVANHRHRVTVPFDERSRGFVWFFSFLAYFSDLEAAKESELILLLDEPALALHATAQRDLLRFMEDRLAPEHQVLYTTHSPFMIDPEHLERARTVMDVTDQGTKISADVFCVDEETVFPLRAALGHTLGQGLFSGAKTLLVENPGDLIYLDLLGAELFERGMPTVDSDWVRVPVGGAGTLATFLALAAPNSSKLAVIVDARTRDSAPVRRLVEDDQVRNGSLVILSEVTGVPDADIEDLFDPEFYLRLVNRAYQQQLADAPIGVDDLPTDFSRITKRIDSLFAARRIAHGKLDRFLPASALLRGQSQLMPLLDDATRIRFAALAKRINEA